MPSLDFVATFTVSVAAPVVVGETAEGLRRLVAILGGYSIQTIFNMVGFDTHQPRYGYHTSIARMDFFEVGGIPIDLFAGDPWADCIFAETAQAAPLWDGRSIIGGIWRLLGSRTTHLVLQRSFVRHQNRP